MTRTVQTPEASGAAGDGIIIYDAAITNGSATLTSASSNFPAGSGLNGKSIWVAGAGASGATLATTISSRASSTTLTLATNASTTVSGKVAAYGTNDTTALNTWLALAGSANELLATDGATYLHNAVLSMTSKTDGLVNWGSARFVATVPTASAIKFVTCTNLEMHGGLFDVQPAPTTRGSTTDHHKLYFQGCTGLHIFQPTVLGSHAVGIMLLGCTGFDVHDPRQSDTMADGFHMTGASAYGRVYRPVSSNTGDDGVAIVSYNTGEAISHHIDVFSPKVYNQTGGRGLSVIGGQDINFTDIDVSSSYGAAVYVANETSFTSWPTNRVRFLGGRVSYANTSSGLDHGAVLVYNSINGSNLGTVTVEGLEIHDTRVAAGGSLQLKKGGSTGTMSGITFKNIRLLGYRPTSDYTADAGLSATQTNVTQGDAYGHIGARVYNNATQSVANTTLTTMTFTTARWQDMATFWTGGSATRLTVPVAGTYHFGHCFEITQPLNDFRTVYADLYLNGTTIITEHSGAGFRATGNTGDTMVLAASTVWKCSAGDYIEARIYQNSGATCTVSASSSTVANGNDIWAELVAV